MNQKAVIGKKGEALVAHELEKKGFTILARNYKKRYGEIDLIACKDELIVFVEVKMRNSSYFNLSEVIVPSKQKKIITVAKEYLAEHNYTDKVGRFDVALIEKNSEKTELIYIPNAFTEDNELN